MIDHPEQFPHLNRPAIERSKSDPLPHRERQLLDALKRAGLEVSQSIGKRGNRWPRYVRKVA